MCCFAPPAMNAMWPASKPLGSLELSYVLAQHSAGADSRGPFCLRWHWEICCFRASSALSLRRLRLSSALGRCTMRRGRLNLFVAIALAAFVGCSRRERVSTEYVLVTPESWNPDGHPGTALHFRGRAVWPNIYTGSGKTYHNGIFVFSAPVPGGFSNSDGIPMYDYSISPQLFAIRGGGPPVIISERIVADALDREKGCHLWQVTPIDNGVRAEFEPCTEVGSKAHIVRDVSWADIQSWAHEADLSVTNRVTPLGTYRVLQSRRPNPQGGNGSQPFTSETNRTSAAAGSCR